MRDATLRQAIALTLLLWFCQSASAADRLRIVATHAHDPGIFTQGLALRQMTLYQSSGLRGRSAVLRSRAGRPGASHQFRFAQRYFAEGLTLVGEEVLVLTWQAGMLFVLDHENLQLVRKQPYDGEGWGLAYDGEQLWMSDGSDRISRRDPTTLEIDRHILVRDDRGPVTRINELEWAHGAIFANVWKTNRLLAIDPATGIVQAEWDLAPLLPKSRSFGADGVANGIAYDVGSGHFWLTGKGWPVIYEVELQSNWLDKQQLRR